MEIILDNTLNTASELRSLEGKMLMLSNARLMFFTDLKIEVKSVTTSGLFKRTRTVTCLTGCKFYGYNDCGEFVGVYDEKEIEFRLRNYDFWELRKKYLGFEREHKALLDRMDEIVAIEAGIHPSIIG